MSNPEEYTEEKAKNAISLIARNADMLEQTSENLSKLERDIHNSPYDLLRSLDIEVRADQNEGVIKTFKGNSVVGRIYFNKESIKEKELTLEKVKESAIKHAEARFNNIIHTLQKVGTIAHKVHLDFMGLTSEEKKVISELPETLAEARLILQGYVANNQPPRIPDIEKLIQAQRDINFLNEFATELGDNAGQHVITYNSDLVDRYAKFVTVKDIEANDPKHNFESGLKMLGESHDLAVERNPSYRKAIGKRTPLELYTKKPEGELKK